MFLYKIKRLFKRYLRVPRIYFAKGVKGIEADAIIFFPVYTCRLNCGLTGIVTYKKKETAPEKIPMEKIESSVLRIGEYTLKKLEGEAGFLEHYLGGEDSMKELQEETIDRSHT